MNYEHGRVLALYPTSSGYAFAYFEKPGKLIDWAARQVRGPSKRRNAETMADIEIVLGKYQPDFIVLEDWTVKGSRRSERIRHLHGSIAHAVCTKGMEVERYTRDDVRETFMSVGAVSRYEVAQAVTREFPELAFRLPKRRRAWEAEPAMMGVFAAVALAITHYRRVKPARAED